MRPIEIATKAINRTTEQLNASSVASCNAASVMLRLLEENKRLREENAEIRRQLAPQ